MSRTWFTAGLRLGESAARDRAAERWNDQVNDDDVIWVLGDLTHDPRGERSPWGIERVAATLVGRIYLVAGPGDPCHHSRGDGTDWVRRYRDAGIADVVTGRAVHLSGAPFTLPLRDSLGGVVATVGVSHFPPGTPGWEDHGPRKLRARDLPPNIMAGSPTYGHLLHAGVGSRWTVNGSLINVSADVWDMSPVPSSVIASLVTEGMPVCDCDRRGHPMGSPGCVLNEVVD